MISTRICCFEIIDNNVREGQLIAVIKSTDYAFTFTGELKRLD